MSNDLVAQYLLGQLGQRGQRQSPQSAMAARLMEQGASTAPVYSPMAGLARALTGAVGGWQSRVATQQDDARREDDFQRITNYQTQERAASDAAVQDMLSRIGGGGGAPQQPAPGAAPMMTAAPPAGPVAAEPLQPPAGVQQRGEAPPAVTQGINARRALDPNSPTYAQDIMAINNGVVAQTMPGQQPRPVAPAAPAAAPQAAGPDYRGLALAAAASRDPRVQALAPIAAQFANRDTEQTVVVGNRLVDRRSGRVIAEFPAQEAAPVSPERHRQDLERAGAGRPSVEVRTGQTFGEALGRNTAEQLQALQTEARTGMETVQSVQRIRQLLDAGAITGSFADGRLGFERALTTMGLIDGRRVTNTEQLMAELANNVLAKASQMTGVLTDRDIQFLREAAGGSITLDARTIRQITELAERGSARLIERYNNAVEPLQNSPDVPEVSRRLYAPLRPAGAAAPAAASGGPQVGAVENGYRFRGGNPGDPNNWERVQ